MSICSYIIFIGKFCKKNVEKTKREQTYYLDFLQAHGCNNLKQVLIMTIDGNGKVYLQEKGKHYQTFFLNWEETLW